MKIPFCDGVIDKNNQELYSSVMKPIIEWVSGNAFKDDFGRGIKDGSYSPYIQTNDDWYCPVIYWTYGRINFQFEKLLARKGFKSEKERLEMLEKINSIPGVQIDKNRIDGRPAIQMETLMNKNALKKFIEFLEWFKNKVKAIDTESEE